MTGLKYVQCISLNIGWNPVHDLVIMAQMVLRLNMTVTTMQTKIDVLEVLDQNTVKLNMFIKCYY